ncbi:hypothetical protein M3P21_21040 [Ruegeria sp. 2012CJ41-6]|uniref:DUF6538 domain-containing protein n=1 Tax=Ruegeria spongiae TaxID=2942209 RepID=A0ABT0Q871_9RHOB|nr:DUF6538 domain-containing protein [Ruegeria spongiae]MCL6286005.1 hypothetical protein [Ruegeria spongiae]
MAEYELPTVPGTQQRGPTYHFNIPIPKAIRDLYDNKAAFRGTMKTSDPKEAKSKVELQRTVFDQQVKDRARAEDRERLSKLLTDDQKAALEAIGGVEEVPAHIAELRKIAAFLTAGEGATEHLADDEEADLMSEIQHRAELAANAAYREALVAEIRGTKRIANSLKIEVPDPIKGTDEGVLGLRDVAERFLDAKDYTPQNREKLRVTTARFSHSVSITECFT